MTHPSAAHMIKVSKRQPLRTPSRLQKTSDAVVEHIHSTAESGSKVHPENPILQPFSCSGRRPAAVQPIPDDSACSATSTATTIGRHSPFGSYPDNVVVSLLCPPCSCGSPDWTQWSDSQPHCKCQETRWWLTDKAWKIRWRCESEVISSALLRASCLCRHVFEEGFIAPRLVIAVACIL